jgi:hypothetical protein
MEALTVETLGTVAGATAFIYLSLALFVKPVIQRKSEAWQKKNAGIVTNFCTVALGQVAVAVAGFALGEVVFSGWVNLVLVGLAAAGASTGIYEAVKNFGKATA